MRWALAAPVAAVALLLAGCTPVVALTPAPQATSVGCAGVIVRLPATIGGAAQRTVNAQGTAAWGSPATVTLTCGVATPQQSGLSCFQIGGVDWLVDDQRLSDGSRAAVFTTFGRSPGVQIIVKVGSLSRSDVLPAVSDAIGAATTTTSRTCKSLDDLTSSPSPGPSASGPSSESPSKTTPTASASASMDPRMTHGPGPSK